MSISHPEPKHLYSHSSCLSLPLPMVHQEGARRASWVPGKSTQCMQQGATFLWLLYCALPHQDKGHTSAGHAQALLSRGERPWMILTAAIDKQLSHSLNSPLLPDV